jgi:hypothetical protein
MIKLMKTSGREINNVDFSKQYKKYLWYLAHIEGGTALTKKQSESSSEGGVVARKQEVGEEGDLLVVVYYLLLQDRVEEAKDLFREVEKLIENKKGSLKNVEMELQYDYIAAFLDFFTPFEPQQPSSSSSSSSSSSLPSIPPLTVARKV